MTKLFKVAIDAGHGLNTPGKRSPADEREWSFNDKVVRAAIAELGTYENVTCLRLDDATGKVDIPLKTRTDRANAWGADVLISVHHNANTAQWGAWGGVETFVYLTASAVSVRLANAVQPRIVKAMGLRDRGVKRGNLHMVRASNMPAILTEGGFMDSTTDIGALRDDGKLRAQGVAIAEGIAATFGLRKKAKASHAKKEAGNMLYQPSNRAIFDATADVLRRLETEGERPLSVNWRKQLEAGELSVSDAVGLLYVAVARGLLR